MSDGAQRSAADGVFGGLEAFDDTPVDTDAMDRMLLTLASTTDPPDWHLDALSSDFYSSSSNVPPLPLQYIDTATPTTSAPPPTPAVPGPNVSAHALPLPPDSAASPFGPLPVSAAPSSASLHSSRSPPLPHPLLSPSDKPPASRPPPNNRTVFQSQIHPLQTHPTIPNPSKLVAKRSAKSPNPVRSSTSSGSSARPRAPTALCTYCSKHISTNGANFRRHEQACRRQRSEPLSDPTAVPSPSTTQFTHHLQHHQDQRLQHQRQLHHQLPQQQLQQQLQHQHLQQQQEQQPPQPSTHSDGTPSDATLSQALSMSQHQEHDLQNPTRRDSDLLSVVRRLEASIDTFDVNARICLRDALLSLSNKASNPSIQPTPQQEALNRAAEYLVLRMLFLSGQQVMHTPPGTNTPYPDLPMPVPSSSGPSGPRPTAHPLSSPSMHTPVDANAPQPPLPLSQKEDGTVAASTGTTSTAVPQPDDDRMVVPTSVDIPTDTDDMPGAEDKTEGGT